MFSRFKYLFIFSLISVAGCQSTNQSTSPSDTLSKPLSDTEVFPVIDAHTHTDFDNKPESNTQIMFSQEQYLKEFKSAGIVGAVSHTNENGEGYHESLKAKGVVFCIGISELPNYANIEAGLRSKKYSCMKIYLGYIHKFASDQVYRPIYRLAQKYDVPVVFHTGDTYDVKGKLKYADPLTVDEVAVDFPKVRFVLAHMGNPWISSAAEVAYKNPNVYLDGSALLIGNMNNLSPETVEEYLVKPVRWAFGYMENPKKLMFGTDWPLNDISAYLNAFKRAIPKEHWRAVFHDNAKTVFKIP
jgi:hypothetical protein